MQRSTPVDGKYQAMKFSLAPHATSSIGCEESSMYSDKHMAHGTGSGKSAACVRVHDAHTLSLSPQSRDQRSLQPFVRSTPPRQIEARHDGAEKKKSGVERRRHVV